MAPQKAVPIVTITSVFHYSRRRQGSLVPVLWVAKSGIVKTGEGRVHLILTDIDNPLLRSLSSVKASTLTTNSYYGR
jgi:hypothetical protein